MAGQWPSIAWPRVGRPVNERKMGAGECLCLDGGCASGAAEQTEPGSGVWWAIKPAESLRQGCLSAWHRLGPRARRAKQARRPSSWHQLGQRKEVLLCGSVRFYIALGSKFGKTQESAGSVWGLNFDSYRGPSAWTSIALNAVPLEKFKQNTEENKQSEDQFSFSLPLDISDRFIFFTAWHIRHAINIRFLDEQSSALHSKCLKGNKPMQIFISDFSRWLLHGRLQPLFVHSMSSWKLREFHRCGLPRAIFFDFSMVAGVQAVQHAVHAYQEHTQTLQVFKNLLN